jgi:hypothetical protein
MIVNENIKRFGTYSIVDNKIRISYNNGTDSVLFEDISSISFKSISYANILLAFGCTFLGLIISFSGSFSGKPDIGILGIIIIIVGIILAYVFKIEYDNIIIETRGGKLIVFTVDHGSGKKYIDKIEEDRRNTLQSN